MAKNKSTYSTRPTRPILLQHGTHCMVKMVKKVYLNNKGNMTDLVCKINMLNMAKPF